MTNRDLLSLLRVLNSGKYEDKIFLRKIGSGVYLAKVWTNFPRISKTTFPAQDFFFVKAESQNVFVAAVNDMGESNLHWVVAPKFRRKGYLSSALRNVILPWLFQSRDKQLITVDSNRSKTLAKKLGFTELDEITLELTFDDVLGFDWGYFDEIAPFSQERRKLLKDRANYAFDLLKMIRDELDIRYQDVKSLDDVLEYQRNVKNHIEDIGYEYNS